MYYVTLTRPNRLRTKGKLFEKGVKTLVGKDVYDVLLHDGRFDCQEGDGPVTPAKASEAKPLLRIKRGPAGAAPNTDANGLLDTAISRRPSADTPDPLVQEEVAEATSTDDTEGAVTI